MKTKIFTIVTGIMLLMAFETATAQKSALYGSWQSSNGNITSFTETTMTVAGSPYRYTVNGNIITVYDENNNTMQYKYQVQGNQLYLYVEGYGTYVLTKVTGQTQNNDYGNNGYGNNDYGNSGYGNNGYENNAYGNNGYGNQNNQGNPTANARLYGTFCSYSSSGYNTTGSYSTTEHITFDGRGHYTYGSNSSYSGGGDGYYGGDGGYTGTYRVVGNKGVILTASDGSQYQVAIHFVQDSGEITELKYGGTIYAKSLCE